MSSSLSFSFFDSHTSFVGVNGGYIPQYSYILRVEKWATQDSLFLVDLRNNQKIHKLKFTEDSKPQVDSEVVVNKYLVEYDHGKTFNTRLGVMIGQGYTIETLRHITFEPRVLYIPMVKPGQYSDSVYRGVNSWFNHTSQLPIIYVTDSLDIFLFSNMEEISNYLKGFETFNTHTLNKEMYTSFTEKTSKHIAVYVKDEKFLTTYEWLVTHCFLLKHSDCFFRETLSQKITNNQWDTVTPKLRFYDELGLAYDSKEQMLAKLYKCDNHKVNKPFCFQLLAVNSLSNSDVSENIVLLDPDKYLKRQGGDSGQLNVFDKWHLKEEVFETDFRKCILDKWALYDKMETLITKTRYTRLLRVLFERQLHILTELNEWYIVLAENPDSDKVEECLPNHFTRVCEDTKTITIYRDLDLAKLNMCQTGVDAFVEEICGEDSSISVVKLYKIFYNLNNFVDEDTIYKHDIKRHLGNFLVYIVVLLRHFLSHHKVVKKLSVQLSYLLHNDKQFMFHTYDSLCATYIED